MIALPEYERVVQQLERVPRYEANAPEIKVLAKERELLQSTLIKRQGGWFGLGRTMHRAHIRLYRDRLADIDAKLAHYRRVADVLAAGYDPYRPNPKMTVGYLTGYGWRPAPRHRDNSRYLQVETSTRGGQVLEFNAPLPPHVLDMFERARSLDLFTSFLVASYQRDHFRAIEAQRQQEVQRPRWVYLDPVLMGTLDKPRRVDPSWGSIWADETFLIAQWDLSDEVKLLTSSATSGQ